MNPKPVDRWTDCEGNEYFTVELGCVKCDVKITKQPVTDYIYVMQCENGMEVYEDDPSIGIRNLEPDEYSNVVLVVKNIIETERRN